MLEPFNQHSQKGWFEMTTISANPNVQNSSDKLAQVRRARQGLLVFAAFLIPLSMFGYWFNIKYPELPLTLPIPVAVGSSFAQFALIMFFAATVAILLVLPTTAGEEIGWRGYLLPRMIEARIPQPIVLSSLIWGAWHLPVLVAGVFAMSSSHLTSAIGLMVTALALGSILARLRLTTGSV
jgi:membrane protease YdiL (CAAX protease family)